MVIRKDLFPIGMGTWGVGGFVERNPNNDDQKQISAMVHMLRKGINYIELNVWTAQGCSVELVSNAVEQSGINRENLFLSQAIYSYTASTLEAANNELEKVLKLFGTKYIDSLSLNEAAISTIGKDSTYTWYEELLNSGKVHFINLNNPSLQTLEEVWQKFGDKLFSAEVGFNFEIRENDENGVIDFAIRNNVLCVIYQPLRRNRTAKRNWPLLLELSKKYNKSQNQILLNWIISRGFLPITKSETIAHIDEHINSTKFSIDSIDLKKLDNFRPQDYQRHKVYWGATGEGVRIDQLSNVFDDEYDKQNNKQI